MKKDHAPVRRLSGSREAPRRNETWGASEGNIVLWLVFEPKVDFSDIMDSTLVYSQSTLISQVSSRLLPVLLVGRTRQAKYLPSSLMSGL